MLMVRLKKVISSHTLIPFSTMIAISFLSSNQDTKDFLNSSGPENWKYFYLCLSSRSICQQLVLCQIGRLDINLFSPIFSIICSLHVTFLPAVGAKADKVHVSLQVIQKLLLQHHLLFPAGCIHLYLKDAKVLKG